MDLVIIAKTLAQKPDANLAIHLIDTRDKIYVSHCDFENETRDARQVTKDTTVDHAKLNKIWHTLQAQNISENRFKETVIDNMHEQARHQQFIRYLKTAYPQARLSLYVHGTTDNYLEYVNRHKLPYPSVITTADIQDEMSMISRSIANYEQLCNKTLQHKPEAQALWLAKDLKGVIPAGIRRTSGVETAGAQKFEIKEKDQPTTTVYVTIQKIPAGILESLGKLFSE